MSFHALHSSVAAFALAAVIGCAVPAKAQTVRDLSPEQTQVFNAGLAKPNSLSILALLDRANATYGLGDIVRLAVKSNEDAYVTVFNIGASGKVTQLFPNAFQTENRIKAGETLEIPSQASGTQIKVSGPVGAELIKVIATSKPVTIIPDKNFQAGTGIFRSLEGGADALNRDLAVMVEKPPADTKVAVLNQVIKTVPAQAGGAVALGALVVPTATAPAQTQPLPLLLATDKRSYKVGEPLTIGVTPLRPCHLAVYGSDQSGKTRLLYPTSLLPATAVAAMQTVMVSGGPSPQSVIATAPGTDTITAICAAEPRPATVVIRTAADVLSDDEKSAFERELAAVPARPADTTGFAQTVVTITP